MKKFTFSFIIFGISTATYAAQHTPVPDVSPVAHGQQIVINIPQQRLFFYQDGKLKKVYPVGVGKAISQTNLGKHKIGAKAFNPTWHIPKSIQRERGDGVKTVPPGPKNPLGPVFVRLGNPKFGLGIHGTSNPNSVPGVVSHGCVRMKSPDALEFARNVQTGADAFVSYELAALNQDGAGNLWLAVFKDPYRKNNLPTAKLQQAINSWANAHHRPVSAALVSQTIKAKTGNPVCLSCAKGQTNIKGDLKSLAWNSGSHEATLAYGGVSEAYTPDEILPEGTAIEVEAEYELDKFQGTSVFDDDTPAPPTKKRKKSRQSPQNTSEIELKPTNLLF